MEYEALIEAIEIGDVDSTNNFFKNCLDVNKVSLVGMSPLIFAIKFALSRRYATRDEYDEISLRKNEIISHVINAGVNVNARDMFKDKTPLMLAFESNLGYEVVSRLIRAGSDINAVCSDNKTPLIYGIQYGDDDEILFELIDKCVNINHRSSYGWTPLFYAVQYNKNINVIKKLIDAGADVHVVESSGKNLLMNVCHEYCGSDNCDKKQLIEVLVKSGVNIKGTDIKGNTVLHWTNCNYLITLAARNGVGINSMNDEGKTPLFVALFDRHFHKVENLLLSGANPSCVDFYLNTPLHFVGLKLVGNIVPLLLHYGANLYARNAINKTPLDAVRNFRFPRDIFEKSSTCAILKHFFLFVDENGFNEMNETRVRMSWNELNCLNSFKNNCKLEIDLMRVRFIVEGLSFYQFCILKRFRSDKVINVPVLDFNYNLNQIEHFPIYHDIIVMRILSNEDERCKNVLLKNIGQIALAALPSEEAVSNVNLDYYCLYEICSYLTRKQLYNFFISSIT